MDTVSQIKEKLNIVDFISGYVPLKNAGKNYKGNCPFHQEKTPSFIVSPDIQRYRCFGCGKSGDIFNFFMEFEGVDFSEAVKALAEKAGVEIKDFQNNSAQKDQNDIIYKINNASKNFYEYMLHKHPTSKFANEYLTKRNITPEIIREFKIGYAPAEWEMLSRVLIRDGYKTEDLVKAGVSRYRKSSNDVYDMFRDRIVFPLIDHMGKIIGFSARSLSPEQMPKYINTQETPIFHKEKFLFGINVAKKYIKDAKESIIVESEFDMISLYQNGYKNVVASKGTALTAGQVNLLKRYADTAVLIFDNDVAGVEASIRGIKIIQNAGLNIKIGLMPKDSKDPDEMMQKDKNAFKEVLEKALPLWDYYFYFALQKFDIQNVFERQKASHFLYESINEILDNVTKSKYIKKFADLFEMDEQSVITDLQKFAKGKRNEVIISHDDVVVKDQLVNNPELYFIALLINSSGNVINEYLFDMEPAYFFNPIAGEIIKELKAIDIDNYDNKAFYDKIADSISNSNSLVERLYLIDLDGIIDVPNVFKKEVTATKSRLLRAYHTKALKDISKALKLSETVQDQHKIAELIDSADKHRLALKELSI